MITETRKDKDAKIQFIETSPKVDVSFTYFGTRFDLVCESFFSFIFMVRTTRLRLCYFHWNSIKKTTLVSTSSWVGDSQPVLNVYQIQMEEDNKNKDIIINEWNICMIVSIMDPTLIRCPCKRSRFGVLPH